MRGRDKKKNFGQNLKEGDYLKELGIGERIVL
jgi:hypothetical protein